MATDVTLVQIVTALGRTYRDQGVALWLLSPNRHLGGAAPLQAFVGPGGPERVAEVVATIDGFHPSAEPASKEANHG